MAFRLETNPRWASASGHRKAFAQGLWTGALAIVVLTFAGFGGDIGMVSAIFVTAVLPGALIPLSVADVLYSRRATQAGLSLGIAITALAALAWFTVSFVLPHGLPLPAAPNDEWEAAIPTLAGLLLAAERLASRGHLAWRDRALGAAAGYAIVGGVFLVGAEWLSWAVLLAVLPMRLHRPARIALAVLSGAAALGLGESVDGLWQARLVEVAAFVAYATASLALARLRPAPPRGVAAPA